MRGRRVGIALARATVLTAALALAALAPRVTGASTPPPPDLAARAGLDQRLGAMVPMEARLTDADGRTRSLASIADGKPLALAFGYYRCPNLCDLTLHGLARAAATMPLDPAKDYRIVFVSIAQDETTADARSARDMLATMDPHARVDAWTLATTAPSTVQSLTHAVGFRYFRDPRDGQYVHPAGLTIVTPDGRVSRYFFGVDHDPASLRLALVEASGGRLGTVIDRLVLFCQHYDPSTGKYSVLVTRLMMVLGSFFVVAMAAGAWWLRRRSP
ncbi:SCO family protein [Luteibacter sp. 329MFSha]|uniref:SCO family protein n=1 Tax=Luteibacter sp. 329MFSha TaxID=1798239 RepID=UPI0008C6AC01|nr:SCO family protein [Luteibacter sp. 329MFSha]SEV84959.1 protein SCO1/2 [Luteibacter sp. 329MFSha]